MRQKLISSFLHILVFVIIEISFVFVILHEFPEVSFFEDLWIIHLSYWLFIFIAWYIRESINNYKVRFFATYSPVVFHIVWHLYLWEETIKHIEVQSHTTEIWLVISTIVLWIFIFIWEYLLHKRYHCEHHHAKTHKHCKED